MNRARRIINAHLQNITRKDEGIEATAAQRLRFCDVCNKKSLGLCELCGCPVAAKVRDVQEVCPLNKW